MGFFSSIGSVLGGIGGALLAPVTGGASIAVGAGLGNVLGGAVDSNKANKTTQGYYNQQMDFAQQQAQFQQDYVRNAMQWRIEDAKKAGVHPMAALGFSSPSFSPVSAPSSPSYSTGSDIDPMEFGQSLNYASAKAKTEKQQEMAFGLTVDGMRLDNQGKQLQNEIAATELLSMQAKLRNSGPAAPDVNGGKYLIPGQGDSPFYISPSEVKASSSTGTQAGIPPSVQWYLNPDGSVTRSMSEQAKQANEEDIINTVLWHYDNNVIPLSQRYGGQFGSGVNPASYAPPLRLLPKGAKGWLPSGYNKFVPVYKWDVPGAFYGE